jgi:hypothetical protein
VVVLETPGPAFGGCGELSWGGGALSCEAPLWSAVVASGLLCSVGAVAAVVVGVAEAGGALVVCPLVVCSLVACSVVAALTSVPVDDGLTSAPEDGGVTAAVVAPAIGAGLGTGGIPDAVTAG